MKNKVLSLLVATLLVCCAFVNNAVMAEPIDISVMAPARAMVVLEGNTNTQLYGHNEQTKMPMASTTKITTAIVAIESCDNLDEVITVSDKAVGIEGTSIYLNKGEQISIRELLYGLMLASGNDCSVALAEHFGGTEQFVDKMNKFVQDIGATNTHYDNPHGLDSDTHYTTAYDLALITSYALKNPTFKEIASTKYHTIAATNNHDTRYLKHKNKLLFSYDDCVGVKTGFTDNAGRCLVNAFERDGMQVISVVLNCGPMFEECLRLTNQAFNEYEMHEFVAPYSFVSEVPVVNGDKGQIGVATIRGFKKPIKKTELDNYRVEYDLPESITAPVEQNKPVGSVKVYYNDSVIFDEPLFATDASGNVDLKYLLDNIIDKWFIS